jgi:hypothetical protein
MFNLSKNRSTLAVWRVPLALRLDVPPKEASVAPCLCGGI